MSAARVPADAVVLGGAVVVLVLAVVLLAAAVVVRRGQRRERALAHQEIAALRSRLEEFAVQLDAATAPAPAASPAPAPAAGEFVITRLGDVDDDGGVDPQVTPAIPVVSGPLFADLVLREGVVQAAALTAGLRRVLAPETRARIRIEMKREVKRSRKARRAELRQLRRDAATRDRAAPEAPDVPELSEPSEPSEQPSRSGGQAA